MAIKYDKLFQVLDSKNMNKNYLRKNGTLPKADVLCKIADYLHVSVDSLLGRDISNDTEIPNADRDIMMKYTALPDSVKASLANIIDELSKRD